MLCTRRVKRDRELHEGFLLRGFYHTVGHYMIESWVFRIVENVEHRYGEMIDRGLWGKTVIVRSLRLIGCILVEDGS